MSKSWWWILLLKLFSFHIQKYIHICLNPNPSSTAYALLWPNVRLNDQCLGETSYLQLSLTAMFQPQLKVDMLLGGVRKLTFEVLWQPLKSLWTKWMYVRLRTALLWWRCEVFHPHYWYVDPADSHYKFTPALWRKQRWSFLRWWMWLLTNIPWQKRLKQCMIPLTANRCAHAHIHNII